MEKRRLNFNHPKDVGLNYWSHLKFTWGESLRSLGMLFVMIIHGIFPPFFDNKRIFVISIDLSKDLHIS